MSTNEQNPTPKSHQQFSQELNELCMSSARAGVGLEIIVLELEIAKLFIFQNIAFKAQQQAQAAEQKNASPIIVPRK